MYAAVLAIPGSLLAAGVVNAANLTSLGRLSDGTTVWRITNDLDAPQTVRLQQYGGTFDKEFVVNPGTTIVYGGKGSGAQTHKAYFNGESTTKTKAAGNQAYDPYQSGPAGPQGPQGATGPQGETGQQGDVGPQGETGQVDYARMIPLQNEIVANRNAIARNAENIANNTAGIAAAMSLAALQQNPHYDGIQTSFGLGYYDGKTGYSGLVGMKLNDRIYGNVGVSYGTEPGAVASITISW